MNTTCCPATETSQATSTVMPPTDIYTNDEDTLLKLDMVGVSPEDIRITFHQGVLEIEGVGKTSGRETTYRRSFTLGETHDEDAITAAAADGVLTVRVGRAARAKPIVIPVQGQAIPAG